jgi:hypothetical protein
MEDPSGTTSPVVFATDDRGNIYFVEYARVGTPGWILGRKSFYHEYIPYSLPARLQINKVVVPASDSGLFNLQINGFTCAANVGNSGSTGAVDIGTGVYTVGEVAGSGTNLTNYTQVIDGDCAPNGTVTVAVGDNKTCIITNTLTPRTMCLSDCAVNRDFCLSEVGKRDGPLVRECAQK